MVDTMVFDHLVAHADDRDVVVAAVREGRLLLRTTHVQEDQLEQIPDTTKREAAEQIPRQVIPSSVFVVGVSRVGMARAGTGDDYEAIRRGEKDVEDAIIAATAVSEAHVLVTEDKRLVKRARDRLRVVIWSADQLVEWARGGRGEAGQSAPLGGNLGAAGRLLQEAELLDLEQRVSAHGRALTMMIEALQEWGRERLAEASGFPSPGQVARY